MEKFPWVNEYPKGVEAKVDYSKFPTLIDLLDSVLKKYAGRPSFESMGKSFTYQQIDEASRTFAAYLQFELGLK